MENSVHVIPFVATIPLQTIAYAMIAQLPCYAYA